MAIIKNRLSKLEEGKYRSCIEELRARGCDVEIPSAPFEDPRALDIFIHRDPSTEVCEGQYGRPDYAISMRMVAKKRDVILLNSYLETEWDNQIVMASLVSCRGTPEIYQVGYLQYPAQEVLNGRIEDSLHFSYPGQMVEGVILFSGLERIPERYTLGMSAPFRLVFLDQLGNEIEVKSTLFVHRERKHASVVAGHRRNLPQSAQPPSVRRTSLFEREDGSIKARDVADEGSVREPGS
jgi:hypothetical protein